MAGIARIHMAVLAFLAVGLLVSISWFEKAWNDIQSSRGGSQNSVSSNGITRSEEKTD